MQKKISNWFQEHIMILSDKSKVVFFQLSNPATIPIKEVIFHNPSCDGGRCMRDCLGIEIVENYKYLGVTLDAKLNWKAHIENVRKSLVFSLCKLYRLKSLCPISVLSMFYHALITSKLQYGLVCWGGAYCETLKPLILIQKHAIRVVNNKHRLHPSFPLFVKCNILPFRSLYVFKVLKLFFIRSGNRNLRTIESYQLRHRNIAEVPRANREQCRKYFHFIAPILFNQVPLSLRTLTIAREFFKELKLWLLNQPCVEHLFNVII